MKITLHIGCDPWVSARLQAVMDAKRGALAGKGVLYPRSPGRRNHTRLGMAVSDPARVDLLRAARGFTDPARQAELQSDVLQALQKEIAEHAPKRLILSCQQLGTQLVNGAELSRLKDLLTPLSPEIEVVLSVTEPATALARHYSEAVLDGRRSDLDHDLKLLEAPSWWQAARDSQPAPDAQNGIFPEVQGAPHWLDTADLVTFWQSAFDTVRLTSCDEAELASDAAPAEISRMLDLPKFGKADPARRPTLPSAAWLSRGAAYNDLLLRLIATDGLTLPRKFTRRLIAELHVDGPALDPGALGAVSDRFAPQLADLAQHHPRLDPTHLARPAQTEPWSQPDMQNRFRASQYLLSDLPRIKRTDKAAKADAKAEAQDTAPTALSQTARAILPEAAQKNFARLQRSAFRPHNRLGMVNEEALAEAFAPAPTRDLPKGSSGNVIVACMKNEAPYILEWIAYHRAIGVDNFLIYTNGCEDSTSTVLDRLDALGIVQHRQNEDWKGKSPQQFALNQALKEPVVQNADWIIHIDVDEFINIRCGNGTLADFFARVPGATNVAMTWRLFGHNGVTAFDDQLVIDQFDTCAPSFCPKPHTVWGFKTMFRNIGAYQKMSCHRPNKLEEARASDVAWVNGSGKDITADVIKNGWRSSKGNIGYDLLQLNHYALRSAESFLIKRQRGRALHVDRSIGLNYWIRMDWSDHTDITIKRNIPRVRAEMDRLMADDQTRALHDEGVAWHRAKADALHKIPEFAELYDQALKLKLTETERVAYALALDLES
ncbi:glycosyltransferase family 2 protein [Pseudaestuariivita sp.]|uniref:glycosyltransferase family 2 protein n=1 Tax=Pseudaestuariivita sp. TaxID=2211669 RepID=UPI0040580AE6